MVRKIRRPSDDELHAAAFAIMDAQPAGNVRARRNDTLHLNVVGHEEERGSDLATISKMFVKTLRQAYANEDYLIATSRSLRIMAKEPSLRDPLSIVERLSIEHHEQLRDILDTLHIRSNQAPRPSSVFFACDYPHIDVSSDVSDYMIYANQQHALSYQLGIYRQTLVFAKRLAMSPRISTYFQRAAEEIRRGQDELDRAMILRPSDPTQTWFSSSF